MRPGNYLLEVQDVQSIWPQVNVDVSAKAAGKVRARLTHNKQPLPFPLPIEPLVAKPTFFEKREGFQVRVPQHFSATPRGLAPAGTGASPVSLPVFTMPLRCRHASAAPSLACSQWQGMLMNPMVIMMGVTLVIMVVFPKMMANMDPEQLKEMQQMQGGLADMLNPEKLKEKQQAQLKDTKRKERRD